MKRFKFSLQTVHDYREFRSDTAEREFAAAMDQLHQAKARLEDLLRQHRAALGNYLSHYQSAEIEATIVRSHADFIASIVGRKREARAQIAGLEKHLETKREALTEALRDTETTGKLRERQRARHELDAARKEQTLMDEMAVAAMARRQVCIR